ncbi:hypothetical protein REPUB_Repub02eG0087600 [Reevesia pubescens]
MIACWAIWSSRNGELHGEERCPVAGLVEFIKKYQMEYAEVQTKNQMQKNTRCYNSGGQIMGVGSFQVQNISDSFLPEALAARKAVELAHDLGLKNIIVEGDSLCIIKGINSTLPDLSPIGHVIDEVRVDIQRFLRCSVVHTARKGNVAANVVARNALSSK